MDWLQCFVGFCFAETMATNVRMSNGHCLRSRSIPAGLLAQPKTRPVPKSLMNINEPVKSEHMMSQFKARLMMEEAKKVIIQMCPVNFQYLTIVSFSVFL